MTEIAELERRISFALDRIRQGTNALSARAAAPAAEAVEVSTDGDTDALMLKVAELEAALATEKATNAQLEERVKALKARQDTLVAELTTAGEAAKSQIAGFEAALLTLREANADLSETSDRLRTAAEEGVTDPALVNRATQAELEALRALRQAEAAEVAAVISELKPIVEEAE